MPSGVTPYLMSASASKDNYELASVRRHVPNCLSLSRIAMALVVLFAAGDLEATFTLVLAMIALAMVSDWADGYLARRWNVCTELGYVLDAMGDRAIHLALMLVVFLRHDISPIYIWLLIFRDILIYAIRVMTPQWHVVSKRLQWLSRAHATLLRVWLCSYFLRDGSKIVAGVDRFDTFSFEVGQVIVIATTVTLSYWGIAKSLRWLGTSP